MSNILTFEQAVDRANLVHNNSYKYLPDGYTTAAGRITFICSTHGKQENRVGDHLRGHGCKVCGMLKSRKTKASKGFVHLEQIRALHPDYSFPGYEENFTVVTAKCKVMCPIHGEFYISTNKLKKGQGCAACGRLKTVKAKAWTPDNVELRLRKALPHSRYSYKFDTFKTYKQHMTIVCPEHGEFQQTLESHLQGTGCHTCSRIANSMKAKNSPEKNLEKCREVHGTAYSYPEPLTKVTDKWKVDCPEHGRFEQLGYVHMRGSRCPICSGNGSHGQRELLELVRAHYPNAISDYRFSDDHRKQIDVYIPELKMGFEYDGIYWHSSAHKPDNYHRDKQLEAKAEGITLYQLFSDEWDTPAGKKLVERRISKSAGLGARKCTVRPVSDKVSSEFHNENHIQGSKLYGTNYGLYAGERLVAVMTFTAVKSHRGLGNEKGCLELARYSTAERVVGGASKLFKFAISELQATSVISYSDNRLFSGQMYEKLGFTKVHSTAPSYSYCAPNQSKRLHKSRFRHSNLAKILGDRYNPNLTERANCEAAGYYQVYDCGLTKWVWRSAD